MKIVSLDLQSIPTVIFWDMDIKKISLNRDYKIIISRILMFTNKAYFDNNIKVLEKKFSVKKIISAVVESTDRISDEICSLLSQKYDITFNSKYSS
ncbi:MULTISPECIES: DUF6922 domain-containing protein [Flavobacteriaceae]|uniref:DUF6922 domain-containing protein n=1 Tax=Paenimyroides tangerinum TaxID=2488728 RepID=A0A3P3VU75_9FLAO|nr:MULTISPECIES: hypothetical protein [Flavobacteriaceae]RRJ86230.1 hypothetical protein EG240_16290 [Paenimyroides tangerinum]